MREKKVVLIRGSRKFKFKKHFRHYGKYSTNNLRIIYRKDGCEIPAATDVSQP